MKGCTITIALFILFGIIIQLINPSDSINPGDRIVVIKDTWGTIDDNAFHDLFDVANARDEIGLLELRMQGRIEYIKQGRYGKVLRNKGGQEQIRFEDDFSVYWVPSSTIKKTE